MDSLKNIVPNERDIEGSGTRPVQLEVSDLGVDGVQSHADQDGRSTVTSSHWDLQQSMQAKAGASGVSDELSSLIGVIEEESLKLVPTLQSTTSPDLYSTVHLPTIESISDPTERLAAVAKSLTTLQDFIGWVQRALSPINSLPDSTLLTIFDHTFRNIPDVSRDISLNMMSRVCKRWRNIILSQTTYWNDFTIDTADYNRVDDVLKQATRHVERSGSMNLRVKIIDGWKKDQNGVYVSIAEPTEAVAYWLLPRLRRVERLSLKATPQAMRGYIRLTRDLPALEVPKTFIMDITSPFPTLADPPYAHLLPYQQKEAASRFMTNLLLTHPVSLLTQFLPNLNQMHFVGFSAPWQAPIYNRLMVLELAVTCIMDGMGLVRTLQRIQNSLHVLVIQVLGARDKLHGIDVGLQVSQSPPVSFPHMTCLTLKGFSLWDTQRFFSYFDITTGEQCSIKLTVLAALAPPTTSVNTVFNTLPHSICATFSAVTDVTVTSGPSWSSGIDWISSAGAPCSLQIISPGQPLADTYDSFISTFPAIKVLKVVGELQDTLIPQLQDRHNIEQLVLCGGSNVPILKELIQGCSLGRVHTLHLFWPADDLPIEVLSNAVSRSSLRYVYVQSLQSDRNDYGAALQHLGVESVWIRASGP